MDEANYGVQEVSAILAMVEAPPTPLPPPFLEAKGLSASLSTLLLVVPEFAAQASRSFATAQYTLLERMSISTSISSI